MTIQLQISHDNEKIQFLNSDFGVMGFTDYTPPVWEELLGVNWYVDEKKLLIKRKHIFIQVQKNLEN